MEYYYSRCNGVTVSLWDSVVGNLFPANVSLRYMPLAFESEVERRFLRIRGDGCGDYDCVVLGNGIGEGSVVFWDHEVYEGPAYLLAGSFSSYFQMWGDNLVTRYLPNGEADKRYVAPSLDHWPWIGKAELEHPWPFNESWMKSRDLNAERLLNDSRFRKWLLRQANEGALNQQVNQTVSASTSSAHPIRAPSMIAGSVHSRIERTLAQSSPRHCSAPVRLRVAVASFGKLVRV